MFQETSSPSEMATVEKILYNASKFVQAAVAEVELISNRATHLLILMKADPISRFMVVLKISPRHFLRKRVCEDEKNFSCDIAPSGEQQWKSALWRLAQQVHTNSVRNEYIWKVSTQLRCSWRSSPLLCDIIQADLWRLRPEEHFGTIMRSWRTIPSRIHPRRAVLRGES